MSVKEKIKADLNKAIRNGSIKAHDKSAIDSFINERANYYEAMEKMDRGGKLSLLALFSQLAHGPFAIVDFLVLHPIKTLKAIIQAIILVGIIYIIIFLSKGGDISQLITKFLSIFNK